MNRCLPLFLLMVFPVSAHALWEWLSPEQYVQQSTLIAILHVGPIHKAWTPENILVESATATVEKVVYYRFTVEEKLPGKIIVYNVFPNAAVMFGNALPTTDGVIELQEGRMFAMLKERGMNKFMPYDGLSLVPLDSNKIPWPTKNGEMTQLPVEEVIEDLEKIIHATKPKQ